jgi:hypothetical protein
MVRTNRKFVSMTVVGMLMALVFGWVSFSLLLIPTLAEEGQPDDPNAPLTEPLYLPLISANRNAQESTAIQQVDGLSTFTSRYWHLSFQYPSDWRVEEPDPSQFKQPGSGYGYDLKVLPAEGTPGSPIIIRYYLTEITPGQSLADWIEKEIRLEGLVMFVERKLVDTKLVSVQTADGATQEILYGTVETVASETTFRTRGAFLNHGSIVFFMYSESEEDFSVVETIASSFVFAKDAPTTLNQMHGEQVVRKTIEEELAYWDSLPISDPCDLPCRDALMATAQSTPLETSSLGTPAPVAMETPTPQITSTPVARG